MGAVARTTSLTIPQEGRLGTTAALPTLLGRLGLVGATGVFAVSRRRLVRRFVLDGGRLEQMVSNAREDRFVDWLLAGDHGLRSDHQQKLAQLSGEHDGPLTAALVVSLGALRGERIAATLRAWLGEMLADALSWKDGSFAIQPGRVRLGDEPCAAWPLVEIALHLAREHPPRRAVRLPDGIASGIDGERLGGLELDTIERALLEHLDEPRRAAEVPGSLDGARREDAQKALERLWYAGLIVPARPPGQVDGREEERARGPVTEQEIRAFIAAAEREDFAALLGVAPAADPAEIRRAYYRTVRRFHPDRFREGPFAALQREIEAAFRLVHEAPEILTDPRARQRWEQSKQAPKVADPHEMARSMLARARQMVAAGRRVDAVALLEKAGRSAPDDPDIQTTLAILLAGNPRRRAEAIATLRRLAGTYPSRTDIHGGLALALARSGEAAEAQKIAARVLELDPSADAARALRGDAAAAARVRQDPLLAPLLG
ncbi:MAG: hypothetical protein Kow0062_25560 [Acidobacteriota bacterium]